MNIENSPWPVTIWPQRENAGMNIKPIAWMYSSRYTGGRWFLTRCQTDLSTYKAEKMVPLYPQTSVDELQRQLAEREERYREIHSEWENSCERERFQKEQLAEREAVIAKKDDCFRNVIISSENDEFGAIALWRVREALALPTDHTALDEAIKQAKVEVLEEAAEWFDDKCFADIKEDMFAEDKLRRMVDEIRRA